MPFRRVMRRIPLQCIELTDPFWSNRQRVLAETSLPLQWEHLESTGRLENFRRAAEQKGEFQGLWFNDSDVYKWAEACAYVLAHQSNPKIREKLDELIRLIAAAQCPDGYLNTYFQLKFPDLRWCNLNMMHEMYCGGHLIEAGVAINQALHDDRLLEVGVKFADHVMSIFGPDKRVGYCGHEEFELALIKLADETNEQKYRDFARWMVEVRGSRPSPFESELQDPISLSVTPNPDQRPSTSEYTGEYYQDHAPIREHTTVVGHAVRAMYLYTAATELSKEKTDPELEQAILAAWNSLAKHRLYVTGGLGSSSTNEGFTQDFDLPNLTAYAETCAACGLALWGQSLLEATGNSDFADVIELALYNGMLAGISLDGKSYFYDNPLESRGQHARKPWFACACCPPNVARVIGQIGQFAISETEAGVAIHLPIGITVTTEKATITVKSNYPWSGEFTVSITPKVAGRFELAIRIPDWAEEVTADLEASDEPADYRDGYMIFNRVWSPSDELKVEFEMPDRFLASDPRIRENIGRVAVAKGPLIYTAESIDNPAIPQLAAIDTGLEKETRSDLAGLKGITALVTEAEYLSEAFPDSLYASSETLESETKPLTLIPYFAWANRGPSHMQVWLRKG